MLKLRLFVLFLFWLAQKAHFGKLDSIYTTRLALASVLGPFGTFAEIHSTHPSALMNYSRLEFHFEV